MIHYHVISLFPSTVAAYMQESILKRAIEDKKMSVHYYDPKDFAPKDKGEGGSARLARIDKKPYGGGPGMVLQAEPVLKAIDAAHKNIMRRLKTKTLTTSQKPLIVFFSPQGVQFDTVIAKKIAKKYNNKDVIFISGRYEGIDARVRKIYKTISYSVGPYVLTGGEIPAMIMIDAISRQIEGVLGDYSSLEEHREASDAVYTRPEVLEWKGKKYRVPKVLLSGNHKLIEEWRAGN